MPLDWLDAGLGKGMIWVTKPEPMQRWQRPLKCSVHQRTRRLRGFRQAHIHLKN